MRNVVFVDGVRTGFGRMGGGIRQFQLSDLLGFTVKALVERTGIAEKGKVDSVFLGSALHDARCNNVARYASLLAGLPYETSATYMEMQCGSGINCINHAAYQIAMGDADVIIAGGGESYSQRFAKFSMCVEPYKMIPPTAIPNRIAPVDADCITMLEIADNMAKKWEISREACDEFAYNSHIRAMKAFENGILGDEVIPVTIPATRKTPEVVCTKDEQLRPDISMEALAKLRTVNMGGVCTAGNSSGRNDGASCVLMMSEEKAKELGYTPIARWVAGADVGVDPKWMGIGPAYSNMKLLEKAGLKLSDIDVFECNEAFAAQNLAVKKEMERIGGQSIDMEKWNPLGGAIAFGHPNGASGGRIAIFAMKQLQHTGGRYGLFSSCCGGGLGVSTLIERI